MSTAMALSIAGLSINARKSGQEAGSFSFGDPINIFNPTYDNYTPISTDELLTRETDKEYVASCEYWCYYGESRSVIGSVKYSW
ncbi:hypothetical protein ACFIOZ_15845 [Vreelandella sp. F11]|uniref:hypothetical protein n=1 Tax=Vreelandella sp. F11 TaxID=3394751 RepID=UPI0036DAC5E5